MRLAVGVVLVLIASFPLSAAAEETPRDVPTIPVGPILDGRLDDEAWSCALVVRDFVARAPVDGAAPSVPTEVRLVCTARTLYVALNAMDSLAAAIRATSMRRDDFAIQGDDQFALAIDTFRDHRNGYWFSTNPLGVRVDAQFSEEGARFHDDWNGVWEVAARRGPEGWTAELAIPWATLRFREAPEVLMGINLFRRIPRTGERVFAPAIPLVYPNGTQNVSVARPYRFRGIEGGARLDVRPFAAASVEHASARSREDLVGGLFARLPVSSAATISGTVRADFSEVEVDQPQLNLTRFPVFLPEKRDFFLEGAGLFAFGVPGEAELFFSRTIGLVHDGQGNVRTAAIDWGVKGAGRSGPLEYGLLSGSTGDVSDQAGERFDVGRCRVSLAQRSTVGAWWSRRDEAAGDHHTYGLDASHFLPSEIQVQGLVAADRRREGAAEAWWASVGRGGERATFNLSALDLEPGFQPALGLIARPGTLRWSANGTWPWFAGINSRVSRYVPGLSWTRFDEDGPGFTERSGLSFTTILKSGHSLKVEGTRERERLAVPFTIHRDVEVATGSYRRWEGVVAATTEPVRPIQGEAEVRAGGLYGGGHAFARVTAKWYPIRQLFFEPTLVVDRVSLPAARFTAWVIHARLGLTASPALRLDLLGQYESERDVGGVGLRARFDVSEGSQIVGAWDSIESRESLGGPTESRFARSERGAFKCSYLLLF